MVRLPSAGSSFLQEKFTSSSKANKLPGIVILMCLKYGLSAKRMWVANSLPKVNYGVGKKLPWSPAKTDGWNESKLRTSTSLNQSA